MKDIKCCQLFLHMKYYLRNIFTILKSEIIGGKCPLKYQLPVTPLEQNSSGGGKNSEFPTKAVVLSVVVWWNKMC